MDVENLAKELILKNMTPEQQMAVLDSVRSSVAQAKEVQKRKIGENVDLVVQALKKIESDIRSRFDDVGNAIEKRVSTIKDGRDGSNGKDGRDGKDGKNGRDGAKGDRGERGQDGVDGIDGTDGVSVSNARIDFDGSLIITLSTGIEINVGEVVAPDLAERIKVITNGGGTSQSVLDTLDSLQAQITALIPSQTGNSGKFLTTNGTSVSWATVSASGGLSYQGTWNASTNTPTLASSTGVNGYYYITATAGSTNLDGITDWQIGDWLLFNGTVWQKIDQSNLVTSVAGRTGAVTLSNTDISGLGTMSTQNANSVVITGGSINGTTVGATTASTGAFSTLTASGTTTLSGNQIISVTDNTNAALRITQLGTGNALLVEDSTNPDATPFVVDASGNVGIGTSSPSVKLDVNGSAKLGNSVDIGLADANSTIVNVGTGATGNKFALTDYIGDTTYTDFGLRIGRVNDGADGTSRIQHRGTGGLDIGAFDAGFVRFLTSNTERIRVTSTGAVAFSGSSNYGTSGQVLQSNGNAAPTWTTNISGTASNVTGTVAIANGGTGQTTRQEAMDTLAGAVTSGSYLRGNGTDVVMSTIQAADVPTLNQNTTGTASNVTGTVAVANGGTGITSFGTGVATWLGTPSSANLASAVTGETGSGALVFGTSPTLTTPTIDSAQVATVSGTAPLYMCRAWVNFNGTGTVAIRGSGNVTSITDNGTGNYTVNLTTSMPDVNYSAIAIGGNLDSSTTSTGSATTFRATGSFSVYITNPNTNALQDRADISVAVFR